MSEILTFPIRSDKLAIQVKATAHLLHRRTEFQTIDIYDTEVFGRTLLLDGHIQLTEFDERAYHECLVQIPLLSLEDPRAALVVGGGDGGVLRELCRSKSLSRIDLVEIDQGVIDSSREHLPELSAGAFDDPRVNVYVEDAFEFSKKASEPYDLIVVDSTDTYEEEEGALSEMLFTPAFYEDLKKLLSPLGLVVTQADNPIFCPYSLASIVQLYQTVFPNTGAYRGLVPSFGGYSAFVWGSVGGSVRKDAVGFEGCRHLNESTYRLAFSDLDFS